MLIVRAFVIEDNAVWSLYLTALMLFETIKQGLLRNPTIKFLGMPEYAEKKSEVQYSALLLNLLFSLLAIVGIVFFGNLIGDFLKTPQLVPLLFWSILLILLLIPFSHCEVMLQAHFKFSSIFWAHFIRQGFFFSSVLILYFFFRDYFSLVNLMILQIAALFLGAIVMFIHARQFLVKQIHFSKKVLVDMLHFGKYIFGTNLFSNLARSFDQFITANVLSPAEGKTYVPYYNVTSRIFNMMDVPSLAAADVLFPKNVQTLETDGLGMVKYHFERMIATILAVIIPAVLFIFFFPKLIIYILAGEKYYGVVPILQLTVLFAVTRPLGYLFGSTLDSIGKPKINFWVGLAYMLISLFVNYICLYQFGGIGAAYASMMNAVIGMAIMIAVLKKYIHLELKNIFKYLVDVYRDIFKLIARLKKSPAAD